MTKKTVFVKPDGQGWRVQSEDAKRATAIKSTQGEAIQLGRRIAINRRSVLIVHRADGTIRSKDSF
jgi:hypothetical protein